MILTPLRSIFLALFWCVFGFWVYSSIAVYFAAQVYPSHSIESIVGFGWVLALMVVGYIIYSIWSQNRTIKYSHSLLTVFWIFLLIHFLIVIAYTSMQSTNLANMFGAGTGSLSIALGIFAKSVGFMILPLCFLGIFYAVGANINSILWLKISSQVSVSTFRLLSVMLWISLYVILLNILGAIGIFQVSVVLIATLIFALIGGREYSNVFNLLVQKELLDQNHSILSWIVGQVFVLALMIFFSSNIISILRPMPIGWDDLGVYMNYPRLIALSGDSGWMGLIAWQHFTSLGFLFGSPTQAFFLSELGGILLVIACILGIRSIADAHISRSSSWPFVVAAGMVSLPMIVFHLAKDMKVDPALFGISVAAFVTLLSALRIDRSKEGDLGLYNHSILVRIARCIPILNPQSIILIAIAGILTGVAFAIKMTTLMLIIAAFAMIFFRYAKYLWLAIYTSLFLGIFTLGKLWSIINVDFLTNLHNPRMIIGWVFLILASALIASACFSQKHLGRLKNTFIASLVFGFSFLFTLSPWIIKNIAEIYFHENNQLTHVTEIISGRWNTFAPDWNIIYSDAELKEKEAQRRTNLTSQSGQTANEDFGRYFGYESWLNNAIKLPLNLTTQINQSGEFTNIGFFFLALVPLMWVALVRSRSHAFLLLWMVIFFALFYFQRNIGVSISQFFATIEYPYAYIYIILIVAFVLLVSLFGLKIHQDDSVSSRAEIRDIRLILVALAYYGFLFWISSYGVVWYGILIYFIFFLIIIFGARMIDREIDDLIGEPTSLAQGISIVIIGSFVFFSAIPHAWTNILNSWFLEYKTGLMTSESVVYRTHDDPILATLNISDQTQAVKELISHIDNEKIRTAFEQQKLTTIESYLQMIDGVEWQFRDAKALDITLQGIFAQMREQTYAVIMNPNKELLNNRKIYRIGTFLTYFIRNNTTRYLDDSLVMEYDRMISSPHDDTAAERLDKLWIGYLLIDLNAATIDRDPRRNLTTRFESLIANTRSDRLKLVHTDSMCLQLALSNKKDLSRDQFLSLAHVNSESYVRDASWALNTVSRMTKLASCRQQVYSLLKGDSELPSFLAPYRTYARQNKFDDQKLAEYVSHIVADRSSVALFEVLKTK